MKFKELFLLKIVILSVVRRVAKKSYSKLDVILSPKNNLEMSKSQQINTTSINNEKVIKVNLSILNAIPTSIYDTSNEESKNRKRKLRR